MVKGLAAIQAVLEAEGIEFTDDKGVPGVRLPPTKRKGKCAGGPYIFGSIVRRPAPPISVTPTRSAHRAQAQEEMLTVNFDALHERARERGWTLTKTNAAARYGTMSIRFVLRDNHGLIHFRNLDEVERRLNAKAKQS
jgi:hypothetical protein